MAMATTTLLSTADAPVAQEVCRGILKKTTTKETGSHPQDRGLATALVSCCGHANPTTEGMECSRTTTLYLQLDCAHKVRNHAEYLR
mmetsp:Transcript_1504/g.9244  ORF Transcript_1504/g.9244 Transcript_1504/m.9244 type:complete len:87 (-) Transcript_1504:1777-2037(-)